MDLEDSSHSLSLRKKNPGKLVFRKFGKLLMHPLSKFLVLGLTIGLTSLGKYGLFDALEKFV